MPFLCISEGELVKKRRGTKPKIVRHDEEHARTLFWVFIIIATLGVLITYSSPDYYEQATGQSVKGTSEKISISRVVCDANMVLKKYGFWWWPNWFWNNCMYDFTKEPLPKGPKSNYGKITGMYHLGPQPDCPVEYYPPLNMTGCFWDRYTLTYNQCNANKIMANSTTPCQNAVQCNVKNTILAQTNATFTGTSYKQCNDLLKNVCTQTINLGKAACTKLCRDYQQQNQACQNVNTYWGVQVYYCDFVKDVAECDLYQVCNCIP